jgi:hypothetical protein
MKHGKDLRSPFQHPSGCPLWVDAVEKSKIERPQKTRKTRFWGDFTTAMLRSVDTKLHGHFSEKRRGPSRRRA